MPTTRKTVRELDSSDVFIAIAHPVRRQILDQLVNQDLSTSNIAKPFDISRSAVSQHLGILVESGLVTRERQGREQMYHLEPEALREVYLWVQRYEQFWTEKLDNLGTLLDELAQQTNQTDEDDTETPDS